MPTDVSHMQHSNSSRQFWTKDNMTIWYRFHNVYPRAKISWITHDFNTILYSNTLMLISKQKLLALLVANLMGCIWSIHSHAVRIELFYVVPNKTRDYCKTCQICYDVASDFRIAENEVCWDMRWGQLYGSRNYYAWDISLSRKILVEQGVNKRKPQTRHLPKPVSPNIQQSFICWAHFLPSAKIRNECCRE